MGVFCKVFHLLPWWHLPPRTVSKVKEELERVFLFKSFALWLPWAGFTWFPVWTYIIRSDLCLSPLRCCSLCCIHTLNGASSVSISVIECTSRSVLKMPCLNQVPLPSTKAKHWDVVFLDFFYLLSLPMVFSLCKTWVKFNEPSFSGLSLFIINSLWCVSSGLAISIASHDICSFAKCRKNVECFMIVHICFHVHVVSSHNRLAFCLCVPNHCEKLALGKS